jgi:hypothetical protein
MGRSLSHGLIRRRSTLKNKTELPLLAVRKFVARRAYEFVVFGYGLFVIARTIVTKLSFSPLGLDPTWRLTLPQMLKQNELLGRDVFFTYGVGYQSLLRLGMLFHPTHSAFYSYQFSTLCVLVLSTGLVSIALLQFKDTMSWPQMLIILVLLDLLSFLDRLWLLRPYATVAAVVFYAIWIQKWRGVYVGFVTGLLACALQLLTFDLGIYLVATVIGVGCLAALVKLTKISSTIPGALLTNIVVSSLTTLIGWLAGNLLISLFFTLSSPTYAPFFLYQLNSLSIASAYSRVFGHRWGLYLPGTVVIFLLFPAFVFFLWKLKDALRPKSLTIFIALFVASVVFVKSALTRSGFGHIMLGFTPAFFTFLTSRQWLTTRFQKILWAGFVMALIVSWPPASLAPFKLTIYQNKTIPQVVNDLFLVDVETEELLPQVLKDDGGRDNPLYVFPFENTYALLDNRPLVAPFIQTYAANTIELQRQSNEYFADVNDLEILFLVDNSISFRIDGVQNVTRSPVVFEYIATNYQISEFAAEEPGVILLERRDSPLALETEEIDYGIETGDNQTLLLTPSEPVDCGLLKLDLSVDYPITMSLSRGNPLYLTFYRDGNAIFGSGLVTLEENEPFSTYVSVINPEEFYRVFEGEIPPGRQWNEVTLESLDTGLFGVHARSFSVHNLQCVEFVPPSP